MTRIESPFQAPLHSCSLFSIAPIVTAPLEHKAWTRATILHSYSLKSVLIVVYCRFKQTPNRSSKCLQTIYVFCSSIFFSPNKYIFILLFFFCRSTTLESFVCLKGHRGLPSDLSIFPEQCRAPN